MNKIPAMDTESMEKRDISPQRVQHLFANDPFSQWLGIEVLTVEPGRVKIRMTVRPEMRNGFGVCHGGITFAFADSALAFASNSHGRISLLLDASMSFPAAVREGDVLTAVAQEESLTEKVGIYTIKVNNQRDELVGIFKGTVYRTRRKLNFDNS